MTIRTGPSLVIGALSVVLLGGPAVGQSISVEREAVGELGMSWGVEGPFERPVSGSGRNALRSKNPPEVKAVIPCSPSHIAGLHPGDVLLRVNGRDTRKGAPFPRSEPGTRYRIEFRRDGEERETTLVVGPPRADAPESIEEAPLPEPAEFGCGTSL